MTQSQQIGILGYVRAMGAVIASRFSTIPEIRQVFLRVVPTSPLEVIVRGDSADKQKIMDQLANPDLFRGGHLSDADLATLSEIFPSVDVERLGAEEAEDVDLSFWFPKNLSYETYSPNVQDPPGLIKFYERPEVKQNG